MEQQPEPARTLPPADAPVRRPGEFDVNDPVSPISDQSPRATGPDATGPGGQRWRVGAVVAVVALLVVGAGVLVQQRRSGDETSVLGTSVERTTTTTANTTTSTASTTSTTTATAGVAPRSATTTPAVPEAGTPQGGSPQIEPPTPPTAHPGVSSAMQVSGVVRVAWFVTGPAAAADPTKRPPATCSEITGHHQVRVTGSPDAGGGVVTLSDRGEVLREQVDGNSRVVCDYTYVAEIVLGSSAFTFELLSPGGEVVDSRRVTADDLRTGAGPFLGHVITAG